VSSDNLLISDAFVYTTYVYYEDTDFSGAVYHANYLKFFERAREHYFGIEAIREMIDGQKLQFVVSEVLNLKYLKAARHGDFLGFRVQVESQTGARMKLLHQAYRIGSGDLSPQLIATALIELALVDVNGKPQKLSRVSLTHPI